MKKWSEFKQLLYNNKIEKKILFKALRSELSYTEQKTIIKNVPRTFGTLLHGNLFPKDYTKIGLDSRDGEYDAEIELSWMVNQFLTFQRKLNIFLALKEEFESQLLIGEYEEAEKVLNKIEKEVSVSYWGMEARFVLLQNKNGYEANLNHYREISELEGNDPCFYFLSGFFHYKSEEDVSIITFEKELKRVLNELNADSSFKEYFDYRLNYSEYSYHKPNCALWVAKNQSIIDKYLIARDVIVRSYSTSKPEDSEIYETFVHDLSKEINDLVIEKLLKSNLNNIEGIEHQNELIDIYDDFTVGKYSEVIERTTKQLQLTPSNFSLSLLYVKCFYHTNGEFEVPSALTNTILETTLKHLYIFLGRTKRSNYSRLELITTANKLQEFSFGKQLMSFVENFLNRNSFEIRSKESIFYTKQYNILDFRLEQSVEDKVSFLDQIPNSITSRFFKSVLTEEDLNEVDFKLIPSERVILYKALWHKENDEHEELIEKLEPNVKLYKGVNYDYEIVIQSLFRAYVELKKFDKAVNLYVDNYLSNSSILNGVEIEDVAHRIAKVGRFKSVDVSNINLGVFMSLADTKTSNIYVAYKKFVKSLSIMKPSEVDKYIDTFTKQKTIHFLRYVCSTKVLSRAVLVFKTSIQVLEERLLINQLLISIDPDNQESYSREITTLTRDLNVQKRKKEIDQSKIYVDEYGLIKSELELVEKGFARYRKISELLKESSIEGLGIGTSSLLKLILGQIDSQAYQEAIKKSDYQFTLFKQLYLDIRDLFLFSDKFGLDYYLSTRIRHGTIEGQLRRPFNITRLVTNRNKETGDYVDDLLWTKKLSLTEKDKKLFQKRIKLFSKNTDDIISELKNELIQIKTEDPSTSQRGLFEFGLYYLHGLNKLYIDKCRSITDFELLVETIFDFLWEMTEINLNLIRKAINVSIRKRILDEIDDFEKDLRPILEAYDTRELFSQIVQCRTSVQKDLDKVIVWFNRSKNFEIDFHIEDVIASSIDTVNNIDPNVDLQLKENIEFNPLIKGEYFIHFDDLLKIFLNNIASYIKNGKKEQLSSEISSREENGALIIEISNDIKSHEDIKKFRELIASKLEQINASDGLRREKNSGLKKAANIMSNVFRGADNEITAHIEDRKLKFRCSISTNNLLVK